MFYYKIDATQASSTLRASKPRVQRKETETSELCNSTHMENDDVVTFIYMSIACLPLFSALLFTFSIIAVFSLKKVLLSSNILISTASACYVCTVSTMMSLFCISLLNGCKNVEVCTSCSFYAK